MATQQVGGGASRGWACVSLAVRLRTVLAPVGRLSVRVLTALFPGTASHSIVSRTWLLGLVNSNHTVPGPAPGGRLPRPGRSPAPWRLWNLIGCGHAPCSELSVGLNSCTTIACRPQAVLPGRVSGSGEALCAHVRRAARLPRHHAAPQSPPGAAPGRRQPPPRAAGEAPPRGRGQLSPSRDGPVSGTLVLGRTPGSQGHSLCLRVRN